MLYSDHAPILGIMTPTGPKPKRRFKFQNWCLTEDDGKISMRQLCQHGPKRKPFHLHTRDLANTIKKWVRKKKPLNQQLCEIENNLSILQQAPPHLMDHAKEENLIQQHNMILDKITDHYRQLSKKHWAIEGDRNTKFFQQACTRR